MVQDSSKLSSLLLEIGTEDIPARFIPIAITQLNEYTGVVLKENRIQFSSIKTFGSPRRLALIVDGIPPAQEELRKEVLGPSKKIAFDASGNPTKAATGFANSQGISVEKLTVKNTDKGEYVAAIIEEKGAQIKEVLPDVLRKIIFSLHFPKTMRWGNNGMRFVRPIRWLLALFNNETLIFDIEGIKSSNSTKGHRFLSPASFQIKEISSYTKLLANNYVVVDPDERKKIISGKIEQISESFGGTPVKDEALLDTVSNLVEYPVPVTGGFSEEYLELPKELLITVMKEHQKYFAIEDRDGNLLNNFIVISNTNEENSETVRVGAERVIRARFEDAKFYFKEDGKKTLESRIEDLKNVTFQDKLGSLHDKAVRVHGIASYLASKINPSLTKKAERAAILSKTDLITGVVREFPELQGIMGRYYAIRDNEEPEVAEALKEQYLPAFHGGKIPETELGTILSLADKIDNLVSFFCIGLVPTGSEDPFALRRQTLGIIAIMLDKGYCLSFKEMTSMALKNLKKKPPEVKDNIFQFFSQRLEPLFASQGYAFNEIQSVIPVAADTPLKEIKLRLEAVREFRKETSCEDFIAAIKRVRNIITDKETPALKPKLLSEEPEKKLYEKLAEVGKSIDNLLKENKYIDALRILSNTTETINYFFDNVLVMDKNEDIKLNRLALLKNVWATASSIADFSKL